VAQVLEPALEAAALQEGQGVDLEEVGVVQAVSERV